MGPSRDFFERYRLIVETNAAWDRPTQHCFPGLCGIYDYDSLTEPATPEYAVCIYADGGRNQISLTFAAK